jgi:hypothetical protein
MFQSTAGDTEKKDIEFLHNMGVASRRLRETFQLFRYPIQRRWQTAGMDVDVSLLAAYKPGPDALVLAREYRFEMTF